MIWKTVVGFAAVTSVVAALGLAHSKILTHQQIAFFFCANALLYLFTKSLMPVYKELVLKVAKL
jgi:hypothetical protein